MFLTENKLNLFFNSTHGIMIPFLVFSYQGLFLLFVSLLFSAFLIISL